MLAPITTSRHLLRARAGSHGVYRGVGYYNRVRIEVFELAFEDHISQRARHHIELAESWVVPTTHMCTSEIPVVKRR